MAPPRKRKTGEGKRSRHEANGTVQSPKGRKKHNTGSQSYLKWLAAVVVVVVLVAIAAVALYYMKSIGQNYEEAHKEQQRATQHEHNPPQNNQQKKQNKKQPKSSDPKSGSPKKKTTQSNKTVPPSDTNEIDRTITKELNKAKSLLDKGKIEDALGRFRFLVEKYPQSPLALYGKARSLDKLAEHRRSNDLLQESIDAYGQVPDVPNCPLELKRLTLSRMAERLNFYGRTEQSVKVLQRLANLFPKDEKILKDLGVQYLMYGNNREAIRVFKKVLKINPSSGFAKSHLGFALKSAQKYKEAIPLLIEGIQSGESKADNGRFYFHLGDALMRTGKASEAYSWYVDAANKGIFLSPLQRSLYNADTPLRAKSWWTPEDTGYLSAMRKLETNWKTIRDEGLSIMDQKSGGFIPEEENLRDTGDWKQFTLYQQGRKLVENCRKTPKTCAIMDTIPDSTGCKRGQVKFSVMLPGTHVWPHTGPTNCRLRSHLGLVIPSKVAIRVGEITRTWEEGKVVIIDDSIEHEVWHNGTSFRLIFIVDFWHPDLTPRQRATLSPI